MHPYVPWQAVQVGVCMPHAQANQQQTLGSSTQR